MILNRIAPLRWALALFALLWLAQSDAQLYKKTAPPGSTFVRLCNGTPSAGVDGRIGDRGQSGLPPYICGDYLFMPPGPQSVQLGGSEQSYQFEAEHYYTVAQTADGQKLFELKGFDNPLKAMVVLFNLLPDTTLSLKTADGKTVVFDNVEPYKAMQREINPLTVTFALFKGDQKIAEATAETFERGKVSSLIVGGSGAVPVLTWNGQK